MAEKSGAGGAFGWLLLGFLGGVAATLAVETLAWHGGGGRDDTASAAPRMSVPLPPPTAIKPPHTPRLGAATSAPAADQPDGEVADDAAAAGMTTRSPSRAADGGSPPR